MLSQPSLRDRLAANNLIRGLAATATTELTGRPSNPASPSPQSNPGSAITRSVDVDNHDNDAKPPIWLHIFPEGQIYQHPTLQMRYFKWGIARYILELPQPPIILPMFFSGLQNVMHEKRTFPRFLPRAGNAINITFGEAVPLERWDKVRTRWKQIRETCAAIGGQEGERLLREGPEAVQLRVEVAMMIRQEVEKLRVQSGYPPAEPESALAETFKNNTSYLHEFEADLEKHINS
ncbi:Tafazzin [Dactylellina cionopaga]|nr:Tafazzin [Dactylellina cionopaga]